MMRGNGRVAVACGLALVGVLAVGVTGCASQNQTVADNSITNAAGNAVGNLAEDAMNKTNEMVSKNESGDVPDGEGTAFNNERNENEEKKSLSKELAERSGTELNSNINGQMTLNEALAQM